MLMDISSIDLFDQNVGMACAKVSANVPMLNLDVNGYQ